MSSDDSWLHSIFSRNWSTYKAEHGYTNRETDIVPVPGLAFTVGFRNQCFPAADGKFYLVYPPNTNPLLLLPVESETADLSGLIDQQSVDFKERQVYGRKFIDVDWFSPLVINSAPKINGVYTWVLVHQVREDFIVFIATRSLSILEIGTEHKHVLRRAIAMNIISAQDKVIVAGEMNVTKDMVFFNFCSGSFTFKSLQGLLDLEKDACMLQFVGLMRDAYAALHCPLPVQFLADRNACAPENSFLPRLLQGRFLKDISRLAKQKYKIFTFDTLDACMEQLNLHNPSVWETSEAMDARRAAFSRREPSGGAASHGGGRRKSRSRSAARRRSRRRRRSKSQARK